MAALALRVLQPNNDGLQSQLDMCSGVTGKLQDIVRTYLTKVGIHSLDEVTIEDIFAFREEMLQMAHTTATQRKYYSNLLEQVTLTYLMESIPVIKEQADALISSRAIKNKVLFYLAIAGVETTTDIDYELRCKYRDYVMATVANSKASEYIKALDQLKLNAIKEDNKNNPLKEKVLKYRNEIVFLGYHPSYPLAMTFYYIRDKEELVFDFSVDASGLMKRQIFKMLNYVLDNKENWHDRRERFLIPLKLLYKFCVENDIEDIEQLTAKQVEAFRESFDGTVGTKTDTYMQIVDNIRKYLFISSKATNWDANVWYLERFNFEEGRENPAREIKKFTFAGIDNSFNRGLLKEYMKYQLGVSQKISLQTVRGIFYGIHSYLKWLDEKNILANEINGMELEAYIKYLESKGTQAESFNQSVISVARFYGYMVLKKKIQKMPINIEYYLKNTIQRHNDRAVDVEIQLEILKALKGFPHHLRLMYLNLWCIGLRVNEVCVIRGDAYYFDGKDAWFRIYQNKMKAEKYVPIPTKLYELMSAYIEENGIRADQYVFTSKKGKAYDAGTFSKQFKEQLLLAGITDYSFRSHDFRHTVATFLYTNGASIEVVRDYLGHKESDMTKKYLDYMSDIIDADNEAYFEDNKLIQIKERIMTHGK